MVIKEIEAKTLLRKHAKIDSWFISRFGMNLYRGCLHNCVYCDGRSEGYYVDGEFGVDVSVKMNAIGLLRRELDPHRRHVPLKKSFIMLGGGVGDSYQPVEQGYCLARQALQVIAEYRYPIHILTKSCLVERDIDLIKEINRASRSIVSFSLSSVDDTLSGMFEPGVPPPSQRLKTLSRFKREKVPIGIFLLPVIPFLTDTSLQIEETVKQAKNIGVDFIIFGGMTLKEGRQKNHFFQTLKQHNPSLIPHYEKIYHSSKWGEPTTEYSSTLNTTFYSVITKYRIPPRVPPALYRDILDINDLVVVILEQIDYLLQLQGKPSSFGYAARSIAKLKEPLSALKASLRAIRGIGPTTEDIIHEIIETRRSSYHEALLGGRSPEGT